MSGRSSFKFLFQSYPRHVIVMVGGLTLAGLLEGVGAASFLPLISSLTGQDLTGGVLAAVVHKAKDFFSIEINISSILGFITLVMLARAMVLLVVFFQASSAAAKVVTDLRLRYLTALTHAAWPYFIAQKSGATTNTLGTEAMRTVVAFRAACTFLASLIQVFIYTAIAFFVSWQVTLAAIAGGGLMMVALSFLVKKGRRSGDWQTDLFNAVLARMTDALYGFKPVKAMNLSSSFLNLLRNDVLDLEKAQVQNEFSDHALRIMSEFLIVALVAAGLFSLSHYAGLPGTQLLFMGFVFLRLAMRLSAAQKYYHNMVSSESALQSILQKIDIIQKCSEHDMGSKPANFNSRADIEFRKVGFSYDKKVVLSDINITIPCRKFTAIYGPSGSGKTTIIDLLCGLIQPETGQIFVGEMALSDVAIGVWRSCIGYVPQDLTLFHDTVLNNLTLSDPSLTRDDAMQALSLAGAEEFVRAMSHGLDTMVGERGARLSGGQRQRISLARALIRKPSVLILDEATSALDMETERSLLQTLKTLSGEMTIIMVTHSPIVNDYADFFYDMATDIQGSQPTKVQSA